MICNRGVDRRGSVFTSARTTLASFVVPISVFKYSLMISKYAGVTAKLQRLGFLDLLTRLGRADFIRSLCNFRIERERSRELVWDVIVMEGRFADFMLGIELGYDTGRVWKFMRSQQLAKLFTSEEGL